MPFGRLDDDGRSRCDCGRDLGGNEAERAVPRDDRGDHAERFHRYLGAADRTVEGIGLDRLRHVLEQGGGVLHGKAYPAVDFD